MNVKWLRRLELGDRGVVDAIGGDRVRGPDVRWRKDGGVLVRDAREVGHHTTLGRDAPRGQGLPRDLPGSPGVGGARLCGWRCPPTAVAGGRRRRSRGPSSPSVIRAFRAPVDLVRRRDTVLQSRVRRTRRDTYSRRSRTLAHPARPAAPTTTTPSRAGAWRRDGEVSQCSPGVAGQFAIGVVVASGGRGPG